MNLFAKYLPVVSNLPDIFHIQWAKSLSEWFFLKKYFKTKIIVSLRGAHINYSPLADKELAKLYKIYFPQVDAFHAVSNAIAKEASKYGAHKDKIKVINSGVDYNKLSKLNSINTMDSNQKVKILSVGRMHWKKGYNYSIDSLPLLISKGINFFYTIIADGNKEEILFQINELGLGSQVKVSDGITQEEVIKMMASNDILLLPSVEEGIANVVLEAMAIGTPVVCSDCGGMKEVIEHGINGFLFKSRDIFDMANKIEECLNLSPESRNNLIKNAKKTIEINFNIVQLQTNFQNLYEDTLSIKKLN